MPPSSSSVWISPPLLAGSGTYVNVRREVGRSTKRQVLRLQPRVPRKRPATFITTLQLLVRACTSETTSVVCV
ncbi:hypothetical protein LX36DRAFT_98872 [Colletotrichum falcatum]|nr:hypothetical protein LX36DRAFT_98872 [Colletotrichum falcatum]